MQWLIDIIVELLLQSLEGMIVAWSGSVENIPDGWHLCNGNEGTPDLRDKFIQGAGGEIPPGYTGGTTSHKHTLTTFGHVHGIADGNKIPDATPMGSYDTSTRSAVDTGDTLYATHIPPYYALCWIMKI